MRRGDELAGQFVLAMLCLGVLLVFMLLLEGV
jgi:hypothetical protein